MASKRIVINGVQQGVQPNNKTPVRLEINDFLRDPDRKNLYLLGLEHLQKRPIGDMKSWYQVAGIHGRPFTAWDGVGDSNGDKQYGYCTHSSILFLSWHRPYMALYEMALYESIQEVVKKFPEPRRSELAKTAVNFRIPYWDWAATSKPHILLHDGSDVEVEKPEGKVKIPNPLYSYKFPDGVPSSVFEGNYRNWAQTLRNPILGASNGKPKSQDLFLERLNKSPAARTTDDIFGGRRGAWINVRERVWHLLNIEQDKYPTYQAFSNNRWNPNGRSSDYDSIESIHDTLHGWLGGGGHMGNPEYAGFDPIFWLHHCNVDRLYALWQALHPDADKNMDFSARLETWWVTGDKEEETTPLVPFRKSDTEYWNSNDTRNLKVFGHTYPEITDWNVPGINQDQVRAKVALAVKQLYGAPTTAPALNLMAMNLPVPPVSKAATLSADPTPAAAVAVAPQNHEQQPLKAAVAETVTTMTESIKAAGTTVAAAVSQAVPVSIPFIEDDKIKGVPVENIVKQNSHREYFANIRAPKYEFNGPFMVHVFMGDFTENYLERPFDPNLVGTWAVFAADVATTECENCKTNADKNLIVTGSIPLTSALLERLDEVGSLDPDHVVPYLTKNLHWRIHHSTGQHENIDRNTVSNVNFSVTSVLVDHPDAPDALPIYHDWNPLPTITAGRPTGATPDDCEGYEASSP